MVQIGIADKITLDAVSAKAGASTDGAAAATLFGKFQYGFPLQNEFGWAGGRFPFAGATNITISTATTWNDDIGFKKVKTLTINAGQTLKITKSPFFIFAEEIVGGGAGAIIDASGPPGTSAMTPFTCDQPHGATGATVGSNSQGGCGGGILFVICNKFSGTAITIKANGGNGSAGTTGTTGSSYEKAEGAFGTINGKGQKFDGSGQISDSATCNYLHPYGFIMANSNWSNGSLTPSDFITGGGSPGNNMAGGSGIGGGASCSFAGGVSYNISGDSAKTWLTLPLLIQLSRLGCRGGGGGASANYNGAGGNGGGGGGAVAVIVNAESTVVPVLQANGGLSKDTSFGGGSGVTFYVNLEG